MRSDGRAPQAEAEGSGDVGRGGMGDLAAKEIDELLKRGAYDVFREDDSDVSVELCRK